MAGSRKGYQPGRKQVGERDELSLIRGSTRQEKNKGSVKHAGARKRARKRQEASLVNRRRGINVCASSISDPALIWGQPSGRMCP